jgi:hypothetical protein
MSLRCSRSFLSFSHSPGESENSITFHNLKSYDSALVAWNRFFDQALDGLTFRKDYVQSNIMGVARLQRALERLTAAIRDVEMELVTMKAQHDPLASHIFISRRHYRNAHDTKGGKRGEVNARLSFNTACEPGFRGSLEEWERLMGAVPRR